MISFKIWQHKSIIINFIFVINLLTLNGCFYQLSKEVQGKNDPITNARKIRNREYLTEATYFFTSLFTCHDLYEIILPKETTNQVATVTTDTKNSLVNYIVGSENEKLENRNSMIELLGIQQYHWEVIGEKDFGCY